MAGRPWYTWGHYLAAVEELELAVAWKSDAEEKFGHDLALTKLKHPGLSTAEICRLTEMWAAWTQLEKAEQGRVRAQNAFSTVAYHFPGCLGDVMEMKPRP